MNDVCYSADIDFGCVDSRILRLKFKFSKVKVCILVYDPNNDDKKKEKAEITWKGS